MYKMTTTILCVNKDDNGVILDMNIRKEVLGIVKKENISKTDLITFIRSFNTPIVIQTTDGTMVHIVKNQFLRTDGDQSKENDLVDLPKCD